MVRATQAYERLKSPIVPLNLVFNADGSVDHYTIAAYVDWLTSEGTMAILLILWLQRVCCVE